MYENPISGVDANIVIFDFNASALVGPFEHLDEEPLIRHSHLGPGHKSVLILPHGLHAGLDGLLNVLM